MIQYVIDFLKGCPFLEGNLLTADFLGTKPCSIGVFAKAAEPVVEKYADGGMLKQFVFRISFRRSNHETSPETACRLWNQMGEWLENQEMLSESDKNFMPQRFEVLKTGASAEREYGTSRYDMDCRLIYYTDKGGMKGEQNC